MVEITGSGEVRTGENMPKVITIQLIQCEHSGGLGTPESPYRMIEQWFTPDGTLVLARDDVADKTTAAMNMVDYLRQEGNK